jgi:hypothetical protein
MNEIAPVIPWKITNKALRELGLKLHDEQTTEHLKEMMAETRPRERQPSQSSIMSPFPRTQKARTEENTLAAYTILARDLFNVTMVMDDEEVERSAHEWALRTPRESRAACTYLVLEFELLSR